MTTNKQILSLSITGSIPDFTSLYQRYGYQVAKETSLRRALAQVKKLQPSIIEAEFVYSPTYGSQLSNFESLLAAIQNFSKRTLLVALAYPEDLEHCKKVLRNTTSRHKILQFPVIETQIESLLMEEDRQSMD